MRGLVCGVILGLLATAARAQPGQVPPPYAYQPAPPPAMLTAEEQELLLDGEISDGQHAGGVVAAVVVGFGIGQAIEGRWSEKGYIFTLGEGGSGVLFTYGLMKWLTNCVDHSGCADKDSNGPELMLVGLLGSVVFRVWGVVDAVAGPGEHNQRVRALRMRVGGQQPYYGRLQPYVVPSQQGGGAVAGVGFTF
jgi:hypothetical protein